MYMFPPMSRVQAGPGRLSARSATRANDVTRIADWSNSKPIVAGWTTNLKSTVRSLYRVIVKPGLWTLEWTVEWNMDWTVDQDLDWILDGCAVQ
jgi:hypothetical protein